MHIVSKIQLLSNLHTSKKNISNKLWWKLLFRKYSCQPIFGRPICIVGCLYFLSKWTNTNKYFPKWLFLWLLWKLKIVYFNSLHRKIKIFKFREWICYNKINQSAHCFSKMLDLYSTNITINGFYKLLNLTVLSDLHKNCNAFVLCPHASWVNLFSAHTKI